MIVEIRDKTYDSVKHASACLQVSRFTIYAALNRGTVDRVGLQPWWIDKLNLHGLKFRSLSQASTALGFHRSFLRYMIVSGSPKAKLRLEQAIDQYKQKMG